MALTFGRHLAQLGGTTTAGDAMLAAALLFRPGRLIDSDAIARYESALAELTGVPHAVAFSAGRIGLFGILRGLGVGAGDEVVVPLPTHVVVPNAIRYIGARPVYADCRLGDYNLDPDRLEEVIGPRTRAVLVQHSFGVPAAMDRLLAITDERGLPLIEDCVHALGASWQGRRVGGLGTAAFFSTEETKMISTTMGGATVTADAALADSLRAFERECPPPPRSLAARRLAKLSVYHLLMQPMVHRPFRRLYELGGRRNPLPQPTTAAELEGERPARYEERLAAGQAELALRQLDRLEQNLAHRRQVAAAYTEALSGLGFAAPEVSPESSPSWVRYPVRVADRPTAERKLRRWIVPGTWFTSVQEEAVSPTINGYREGYCPRAELAARQLVNLPTHPRVQPRDVERIVAVMAELEPAPPDGSLG
jgi:dTDP-4-amino-4,6-dideoxygalactose transaminase